MRFLTEFDRPKTTREAIIWLLAKRQVLGIGGLRRGVSKMNGHGRRGISNQAVWKTLKSLVEEGMVAKLGHGRYVISLFYIQRMREFCDEVEKNYQILKMTGEDVGR